MIDVMLFTRRISIIVRLDGYDNEDFDVTIETDKERKVITLNSRSVKKRSIDKNLCQLEYIGSDLFLIDNLKITCKYPVTLWYHDVLFGKNIEPLTTKKVVVDDKETDKRLWKAKILDIPKKDIIYLSSKTYYTDVKKLSVKEAVEWYNDLKEHLNDFKSVCVSYARGLYYKEDGEWVKYPFEESK